MAIWGKLFGGVSGFATGGPVGAAMGLVLGHLADKKQLLTPPSGTWATHFRKNGMADPQSATFFTAAKIAAVLGKRDQLYGIGVVALCAKLARSDGPVNEAEINAFKASFRFPEENMREVSLMFDHARKRVDDYKMYASELGRAYANNLEPLETLLAVLFHIARADLPGIMANLPHTAPLAPAEEEFLKNVHQAFRLSDAAWERARTGRPRPPVEGPSAYSVLGLSRQASNGEIRARWRVLIRQHHPDVLAQTPMTPSQRLQAQDRVAKINAAWDQIKRDRGM